MRLGHLDQTFTGAAWPGAARGMLEALPSLRTQEAIAFGEGVPLPMRIRFNDLPRDRRPHSDSAKFSEAWQSDCGDAELLDDGIRGWREQRRKLPAG